MFTWIFWRAALERAIKTFAQTLVGLFTGDEVLGLLDIDWGRAVQIGALMALLSLLTSLVSAPIGPDKGNPSVVDTPPAGPDPA